jgi:hypothetical protein
LVAVEVEEPLFLVGFLPLLRALLVLVELVQQAQPLQLMVVTPYMEVFLLRAAGQAVRPLLPCHLEMALERVAMVLRLLQQLLLRLLARRWGTQLVAQEAQVRPLLGRQRSRLSLLQLLAEAAAGL